MKKNSAPAKPPVIEELKVTPDLPLGFGYKVNWMAIKTTDTRKVAGMLPLQSISVCNWESGINAVYKEDSIFITPPVDGWTLVCGRVLPDTGWPQGIADVKNILQKLSKEFGEAQLFSSHRVIEFQSWAKAVDGEVVRIYTWLGEKGENLIVEGEPTEFEKKYKLVNTFLPEAKGEGYFEDKDLVIPHEDYVMDIAGAWSVNPSTLGDRKDLQPGLGFVGKKR